jgi:hypothetical protein
MRGAHRRRSRTRRPTQVSTPARPARHSVSAAGPAPSSSRRAGRRAGRSPSAMTTTACSAPSGTASASASTSAWPIGPPPSPPPSPAPAPITDRPDPGAVTDALSDPTPTAHRGGRHRCCRCPRTECRHRTRGRTWAASRRFWDRLAAKGVSNRYYISDVPVGPEVPRDRQPRRAVPSLTRPAASCRRTATWTRSS